MVRHLPHRLVGFVVRHLPHRLVGFVVRHLPHRLVGFVVRHLPHRLVGFVVRLLAHRIVGLVVRHLPQEWHAWGQYHGGRRPSSDDSFHCPTVIPPSALDKPSIIKRCHHRQMYIHTSPHSSTTMLTLYDTQFVECQWWNDGWTVKTVIA